MIETQTRYVKLENNELLLHFTLLQDQIILVITDRSLQMSNLHLAMQTKYEEFPTATCVKDDTGRQDEAHIQTLARSLCKKHKVNVCLSYNIEQKHDPGFYLLVSKVVNEQLADVLTKSKQRQSEKKEEQQ